MNSLPPIPPPPNASDEEWRKYAERARLWARFDRILFWTQIALCVLIIGGLTFVAFIWIDGWTEYFKARNAG